MQTIKPPLKAPSSWAELPEVDDVRPTKCCSCHQLAKLDGRVYLQGHGTRIRRVIVLAAILEEVAQLGECWVRRYRCVACGATCSVYPAGVVAYYLYSVTAIAVSFYLVAKPPMGEALSHAEAYRRQGMYRTPRWSGYRWRSLDRWSKQIPKWWPSCRDLQGLLNLFIERGGLTLEGIAEVALSSHTQRGAIM